jgi:hypothetical protein
MLSALRWRRRPDRSYGYSPCGCEVHAQRRFGDFATIGRCTVGWGFETAEYAPFFRAEIDDMAEAPPPGGSREPGRPS